MQIPVSLTHYSSYCSLLMQELRFITPRSSRERLPLTRQMCCLVFSYHQVLAEYLDFLFPFGQQMYQRDFHFAGFRDNLDLVGSDQSRCISTLGRSGIDIAVTYSLFSVEEKKRQEGFPWSIRRASLYHSFDLKTARAVWIVTKGNHLLESRIKSTTARAVSETVAFSNLRLALASSLATHVLVCEWASENWRWYINFLEQELQSPTRHIGSVPSEHPPIKNYDVVQDSKTLSPSSTYARTDSSFSRKVSSRMRRILNADFELSDMAALPPRPSAEEQQREAVEDPAPSFSYSELQDVHFVKGKSTEALLIIQTDMSIIRDLRASFLGIKDTDFTDGRLAEDIRRDINEFGKKLLRILQDLELQQTRLQTLVRLIEDRKDLVRTSTFVLVY